MAGITSPKTLTTAGTRQPLVAAADYTENGVVMPSRRYCKSCAIRLENIAQIGYIGLQPPAGKSDTVSSTVYNVVLDSVTPEYTIGPFGEGMWIDLGSTYIDGNTSGMKFIISTS